MDDNPSGALDRVSSPQYTPLEEHEDIGPTIYNFDGDMYSTTTQRQATRNDLLGEFVDPEGRHATPLAGFQAVFVVPILLAFGAWKLFPFILKKSCCGDQSKP